MSGLSSIARKRNKVRTEMRNPKKSTKQHRVPHEMRSGDWIYVETGIKEMGLEITKMDIGLVGWDQ